MRRGARWGLAITLAVTAPACGDDDGSPRRDGDRGGDFWLVGRGGAMLRATPEGATEPYGLESDQDLLAIACRGHLDAWAVGTDGLVLQTDDGGMRWSVQHLGTGAWRSVAAARERIVWIAGDGGTLRVTDDDGGSWHTVSVAPVDGAAPAFAGVATTAIGAEAFAVAQDGAIWRASLASLSAELVRAGEGIALHGVGVTPDGTRAIAVGDGGLVLVSSDGADFTTVTLEPAPGANLLATRIDGDGTRLFATTSDGALLRFGQDGSSSREPIAPSRALHALHIARDGTTLVAGEAGIVSIAPDPAGPFTTVATATLATLHGVDALHGEPHL